MGSRAGTGSAVGAWPREPGTVVRQAAEPPRGIGTSRTVLTETESSRFPVEWAPHSHPLHELVWVDGGSLTARVGDDLITVSGGSGLWLPAGTTHAGRLTAGVSLRNAFFVPDRTPVVFEGPTVIAMTPVLESVLLHLTRTDLAADARARAESVVFDVLEPSERPVSLRVPGDPRIDVIANALLADPADGRGLSDWSALLSMSERTITRAFRAATGLSYTQWRQALRIHRALALLSEGADVNGTAELLGYAHPSTFISAFRRVLGSTPGTYIEAR